MAKENYFFEKGKKAEAFVQELAQKTFLTDWCYPNPILPDGKESCDLLVVFDDIAIIWQIKNLKLGADGKYKASEKQNNLLQLKGARRKLFELKTPIELINPRRGKERFDASSIHYIYLISVLLGQGENLGVFAEDINEHIVHVFTTDFTQIILNELDTISDFIRYLRDKEEFLKKEQCITIMGGEEELLAYYLSHDRSFKELYVAGLLTIDEGFWSKLSTTKAYINKKKEDKISYGWDGIINRIHESQQGYELVARELARPSRFERRALSKAYFDAYTQAADDTKNNVFCRTFPQNNVTYCFLFVSSLMLREIRKKMIFCYCFVARGKIKENQKVIGIATEKEASPNCSYDFCLLTIPEWTDHEQQEMERIQSQTGILTNPTSSYMHEEEYPQ